MQIICGYDWILEYHIIGYAYAWLSHLSMYLKPFLHTKKSESKAYFLSIFSGCHTPYARVYTQIYNPARLLLELLYMFRMLGIMLFNNFYTLFPFINLYYYSLICGYEKLFDCCGVISTDLKNNRACDALFVHPCILYVSLNSYSHQIGRFLKLILKLW